MNLRKTNLRSTWKELAAAGVTKHSAESMRSRMIHRISQNISALMPNVSRSALANLRRRSSRVSKKLSPTHLPILRLTSTAKRAYSVLQTPVAPKARVDVTPDTPSMASGSSIMTSDNSSLNNETLTSNSHNLVGSFSSFRFSKENELEELANSSPPSPGSPVSNIRLRRNLRISSVWNGPCASSDAVISHRFSTTSTFKANIPSVVSATTSSIRIVDNLCRAFPLLTPTDVFLLLYMTSGSVRDTECLLKTGSRLRSTDSGADSTPAGPSPPLWMPVDDKYLLSEDKSLIQRVLTKFGSSDTLKRLVYLSDAFFK